MNAKYKLIIYTLISTPLSESSVCKINIAGYSMDNYKTCDLSVYTVLC